MDWLSEIERKDYFSKETEKYTLGNLIFNKLKKVHSNIFDEEFIKRANNIMVKRNLVHPKEFFNAREKITDSVCADVIKDLRVILNSR